MRFLLLLVFSIVVTSCAPAYADDSDFAELMMQTGFEKLDYYE